MQETYDPGWRARVNARSVPLHADGLNQMVIEPSCEGACTVSLEDTGGTEMRIAKLAQWTTVLAGILWLLKIV